MNSFYAQPRVLQWVEAILLLIVGLLPALYIVVKGSSNPLIYSLFLVYLPIGQFSLTPVFRLTEVYHYYSPMLLGYMANDTRIDLHSGSSFDYLFVMRKYKPGIELRNRLLLFHLEGLLEIIARIESEKIPGKVSVVGTSYFFNSRTLSKIGFEIERPSLLYRVNLILNFLDIFWMYSLAKGRMSIPEVWNAKNARISGTELVRGKDVIQELHGILRRRVAS